MPARNSKILLTSVFKPFGVDNIYSRVDSKIELHHNQLSKYQGVFSMRLFFNSYGLHLIANNIDTPATVLDFPTLDRFRKEVRKGYDIIGIGSIVPNLQKVKLMVEQIRKISPRSTIVLGGFCATTPNIEKIMDVDYVCVGDGISFMRELLGQPQEFQFKNPDVFHEDREILGMPIFGVKHPHICVGLGCSYGCDFCAPSHFFGRRHIRLIRSGRELFEEMVRVEQRFGSNQISFIGDDNFFLDLKRAEELRQCVVDSGKVFSIFLFGSADKVVEFGPDKLAEMGVGLLWLGRESKFSDYRKNLDLNMKDLVNQLHGYGIKTVLSSILLVDQHTRENIKEDIEDHLACRPVFSQFSHYAPSPGTPLYERLSEENRLLTTIPFEDCHAFKQPWFVHPEFNLKEAEKIQDYAYQQDFLRLGPSTMRLMDIDYQGWLNLKDSTKPHFRARADFFAGRMKTYRALLLAMEHLAPNAHMKDMIRKVRSRVETSFGPATAFDKAVARGFHLTGRVREFRNSHWGDAIQPRTRLVHYNH